MDWLLLLHDIRHIMPSNGMIFDQMKWRFRYVTLTSSYIGGILMFCDGVSWRYGCCGLDITILKGGGGFVNHFASFCH